MTAAAKNLYISQSTISQTISSIEDQYKIKIFERTPKKLTITNDGTILLDYCNQIVDLHNKMEFSLKHSRQKSISIGATIIAASSILNEVWFEYHISYPEVKSRLSVDESDALKFKLLECSLDFIITEEYIIHPDLISIPFLTDHYTFICYEGHPLADRSSIALSEIKDEIFLLRETDNPTRILIEKVMNDAGLSYAVGGCFSNIDSLKMAVHDKIGVTILASRLIRSSLFESGIISIPITDFSYTRSLSVVYRKALNFDKKPHLSAFPELLKNKYHL